MLTLAEAVELIHYGAGCEPCTETRRVDLRKLLEQLGPDVLVRDVRSRLKCAKCGSRRVIVTTLWQNATSSESVMESWNGPGN